MNVLDGDRIKCMCFTPWTVDRRSTVYVRAFHIIAPCFSVLQEHVLHKKGSSDFYAGHSQSPDLFSKWNCLEFLCFVSNGRTLWDTVKEPGEVEFSDHREARTGSGIEVCEETTSPGYCLVYPAELDAFIQRRVKPERSTLRVTHANAVRAFFSEGGYNTLNALLLTIQSSKNISLDI